MARFFKFLLPLTAYLFLLTSCQEGGDAGDLLGQWRMTGSDTKYVSFSGSLTLFRSIGEREVYGKFQHVGDSLFIQCYSVQGLKADTVMIEHTFGFKPFKNIRLKIEKLNGDDLILSRDGQTWRFYLY